MKSSHHLLLAAAGSLFTFFPVAHADDGTPDIVATWSLTGITQGFSTNFSVPGSGLYDTLAPVSGDITFSTQRAFSGTLTEEGTEPFTGNSFYLQNILALAIDGELELTRADITSQQDFIFNVERDAFDDPSSDSVFERVAFLAGIKPATTLTNADIIGVWKLWSLSLFSFETPGVMGFPRDELADLDVRLETVTFNADNTFLVETVFSSDDSTDDDTVAGVWSVSGPDLVLTIPGEGVISIGPFSSGKDTAVIFVAEEESFMGTPIRDVEFSLLVRQPDTILLESEIVGTYSRNALEWELNTTAGTDFQDLHVVRERIVLEPGGTGFTTITESTDPFDVVGERENFTYEISYDRVIVNFPDEDPEAFCVSSGRDTIVSISVEEFGSAVDVDFEVIVRQPCIVSVVDETLPQTSTRVLEPSGDFAFGLPGVGQLHYQALISTDDGATWDPLGFPVESDNTFLETIFEDPELEDRILFRYSIVPEPFL